MLELVLLRPAARHVHRSIEQWREPAPGGPGRPPDPRSTQRPRRTRSARDTDGGVRRESANRRSRFGPRATDGQDAIDGVEQLGERSQGRLNEQREGRRRVRGTKTLDRGQREYQVPEPVVAHNEQPLHVVVDRRAGRVRLRARPDAGTLDVRFHARTLQYASMARVRLILFDIDGTLVDAGGAGRRALVAAFDELFSPESLTGAERVPFAGNTDRFIFREMGLAVGVAPESLARRREEFEQTYARALQREMRGADGASRRVLPGVLPLLETLERRSDVRVGLLTGNVETGARIKLDFFDLNRFFPGGGFGDDAGDRRGVARAARDDMARRSGIEFDDLDVVVIGDTDQDVDCARFNGFRPIAVETGWAAPGSLRAANPDALFEDLSDTTAVLAALLAE